jgi:sulfatase modifying factor 1
VRKALLVALLVAAGTALLAIPAPAVTIEWASIGNPGNPADAPSPTKCFVPECGSVPYDYRIARYETTNERYAEFLNAVDPDGSNALSLYNANMDSDAIAGGISFVSGNPPGEKYLAKAGFESRPVTYVSFYDALRFANWLDNGQGAGDTETGAYTLLGGEATPSNGLTVTRNAGANVFLTSENEWYKAAYYSPGGVYFDYPTGTDTPTGCVLPNADTGNSANCSDAVGMPTNVGEYGQSASPYGTFDQGGNVAEWNESVVVGTRRGFRGGGVGGSNTELRVQNPRDADPTTELYFLGFRVAAPEPGPGLLGITAVVCLALQRSRVAKAG